MLSSLQGFQDSAKKFVADNATTILTAGGVVGTVTTGVLAWRGGQKYAEIIRIEKIKQLQANVDESNREMLLTDIDPETWGELTHLDTLYKAKLVIPHVVPPVLIGGVTIAAIIWSNQMSAQKAAALAAAYGMSERQFREYKEKISEKLTGPKEQQVKDELAQERADRTPGSGQIVIVEGDVLCFDELTGRYFRSSMEEIRKAVNDTNQEILHHDHVSASHFYDLIGLSPTTWTEEVGWNTDNLLDLEYSTITSHDNKPCIAINPKFLPYAGYNRSTY